jgi:hypothetical protein
MKANPPPNSWEGTAMGAAEEKQSAQPLGQTGGAQEGDAAVSGSGRVTAHPSSGRAPAVNV